MGGRGSSSGMNKNPYGSQYHTLHEYKNIKFVSNNAKNNDSLMESKVAGRVYAQIGGNDIIRVVFIGDDHKRNKVIEQDKRTKKWHVHYGYLHTEYSEKEHEQLSNYDQKYLEKIKKIWHNHTKQT